jgi:hypothetical protein
VRGGLLVLLLLAIAVAATFRSFILSGTFVIADDTAGIHYPVVASVFAQLREGRLPMWFPEILLGYPGTGSVELHLFSPFHWPFLFFRPEVAVAFRFLSIHLVSALSMYALARHLETSRAGALVAGIVWSLGPVAIYMLTEPMASATVPWLPLVLRGWDGACRGEGWRGFVAGGFALGLALLGGHLQHVLWFGVFLAAYTAIVLSPRVPRAALPRWTVRLAAGGALLAVVALLIGAIQVLPSWHLFRDSIRVGIEGAERLPFQRPSWVGALRLASACLYTIDVPPYYPHYTRVGVPALALALLSIGRRRSWDNRVLLLAAAFLLLAVGDAFPPTNWLLQSLPGNWFRYADRVGLVFAFALALLAGRGADVMRGTEARPWPRLAALAVPAMLVGGPLTSSPDAALRLEAAVALASLFLLAASLFAGTWARSSAIGFAIVGLIVASGRAIDDRIPVHDDATLLGFTPPRMADGTPYPPTWLQELPRRDDHGPIRVLCVACGRGNLPALTGHHSPTGALTLRPARLDRFVYARRKVSDKDDIVRMDRLDLLGVRYVLLRRSSGEEVEAMMRDVDGRVRDGSLAPLREQDGVQFFENRAALPRSFFVSHAVSAAGADDAWKRITSPEFDPRRAVVLEGAVAAPSPATEPTFAAARVTRYETDRVEIEVDAPSPGFVVLLDRWAPGWTSTVDGRTIPHRRANYLFRAVPVAAGSSAIRFEYHDAVFTWAALLTAFGLVGSLGALLAFRS